MAWATLVNEASESDPEAAYFIGKLRDLLEEHLPKIDMVELRVKRGRRGYVPTGHGITVDQKNDRGSPDDGAAMLSSWAKTILEEEGFTDFQVIGYGGDKSAGVLFRQSISLKNTEGSDPSERTSERHDAVLEAMQILKDALVDAHKNYKDANKETRAITTEYVNLARTTAENANVKVELAKLHYQEHKEQRDHEYDLHRLEAVGRMGERFVETAGPMVVQIFGEWLNKNGVKLDPKTATGPYAQRVAAILEQLTDEQKAKCQEILGDKAWDLVLAAAKAPDDTSVASIIKAFEAELGETRDQVMKKLQALSAVIGLPLSGALAKLMSEILQ